MKESEVLKQLKESIFSKKTQIVTITLETDLIGNVHVNLESGDMNVLELMGVLAIAQNEASKKWINNNKTE